MQHYPAILLVSDAVMSNTSIKIVKIQRHYFKVGLKSSEAAQERGKWKKKKQDSTVPPKIILSILRVVTCSFKQTL